MDLEHPDITRMNRTGHHRPIPKIYGTDDLGNTVMGGQEIICINDRYYLVDALDQQSLEILEQLGAMYAIAE